jgi:hypothetical protein
MNAPIETVMEALPWTVVENPDKGDGTLPYVTHHGVLSIAGLTLRCYQLNDGRRIFDADDLRPMFEALGLTA